MFISLVGLCLVAPFVLLIAIIVKSTSKGPILFKQKRIGKNKKIFYILKFRTMYIDTPKDVPTHLLENPDKFITPIGKLLRKTSLDELPQIFNIIIGHMSIVGPRPALYNQYDLISLRDKYNINQIKPGMTGWAQINGRDELEIPEKVQFDKYYFDNRSIVFDFKIILLTIFSVLYSKGVVEGKSFGLLKK